MDNFFQIVIAGNFFSILSFRTTILQFVVPDNNFATCPSGQYFCKLLL